MSAKCQACKIDEAVWAWQPFGPSDTPDCFSTLGNHYRGFSVVKLCDDCYQDAHGISPVEFKLHDRRYIGTWRGVTEVPVYVDDALAYWEAQP